MFLDDVDLTKEYIEEHIQEIKETIEKLIQEGNFEEVKRIQTLIHNVDLKNHRAMLDLIKIAKIENDIDRVIELQKEKFAIHQNRLLEIEELIVKAKENGNTEELKQLKLKKKKTRRRALISLYDLAGIAWKRQDFDEAEQILRKILEIKPKDKRAIYNLEHINDIKSRKKTGNRKTPKETKKVKERTEVAEIGGTAKIVAKTVKRTEPTETKKTGTQISVAHMRNKLHTEGIDQDELTQITMQHSDSLKWIVFVAESYMYLKRQVLAKKTLEDYKKRNPNMSEQEIKLWKRAMEIVKSKQKIFDLNKWDKTYGSNYTGNQDGR